MLYLCILCVALLMNPTCFRVVVILLLHVMVVFSVGCSALLDRPCMVF